MNWLNAVVIGLSGVGCGAVLARRTAARLSGVLLALAGAGILIAPAISSSPHHPNRALLTASYLLAPLALAVYPALPDRITGWVVVAGVAGLGIAAVAAPRWDEGISYLLAALIIVHVWFVLEFGEPGARRAMAWAAGGWILAALMYSLLGFAAYGSAFGEPAAELVSTLAALTLPLAPIGMLMGLVAPEIADVRGLIARAVVIITQFCAFLAVTTAVCSLLEVAIGRAVSTPTTLLISAVTAFAVAPLGVVLRGVIDQLLFGDRPDPLTAATAFADQRGPDVERTLAALREALVLPYAELTFDGTCLARSGTEVTFARSFPVPVVDRGEATLTVGLRPGDLRLTDADQLTLRIMTRLLADALATQALADEVARSRRELIAGREEERRRLRRDLHDGIGPTLTGVAFAADAAGNEVAANPQRAAQILAGMRIDIAGAIQEVRRLVEDLRPPALDELGLIGSLEAWVTRLHAEGGVPMQVRIVAPDDLPSLPAAVEVALYRIVVEALTNCARHSGTCSAEVVISTDEMRDPLYPKRIGPGRVVATIRDRGRGLQDHPAGVGRTSMNERATQLGGHCRVDSTPAGVTVTVELPLSTAD